MALRNSEIQTVNILMVFIYPLSSLYVLSYIFTLSARKLRSTVPDPSFGLSDDSAMKVPQVNHLLMHQQQLAPRRQSEGAEWSTESAQVEGLQVPGAAFQNSPR